MVSVKEFSLQWPQGKGSTHELVISDEFVYVTGQTMGYVAQFDLKGNLIRHIPLQDEAGNSYYPHGILLDRDQQLWVSLEGIGQVVRLGPDGKPNLWFDVNMYVAGSKRPINPAPHGICLGSDGRTIWFTGKRTSTVGRINPDGTVEHFEIGTLAAMPIFFQAGLGGYVWGTELQGNCILQIAPDGAIVEIPIPTANSRPIGIIPSPDGKAMWFTQEAGRKLGKVTFNAEGKAAITEYPMPLLSPYDILGSLSFDRRGALWVQAYRSMQYMMEPERTPDYIVQLDPAIQQILPGEMPDLPSTVHFAESRCSMMHRIRMDREGNLWFTEMHTDKLGKITM